MFYNGPRISLIFSLLLCALLGPGSLRADTPDEQYQIAAQLYDQKIYSVAAEKLRAFLKNNAKHPKAKLAAYQLGSALYHAIDDKGETDYQAAVTAYEKAIAQYPDAALAAMARFDLGDAYFRLGQYEKSIAAYNAFLTSKPSAADAVRALYDIGDAYYELDRTAEARTAYKKLLASHPQSEFVPGAHYGLGQLALRDKKPEEAITSFKTVVEKYPASDVAADARLKLAHAYLDADRPAEARPLYRALLNDADLKTEAQAGLADADFAAGDWKAAARSYEELLKAPGNDERLRLALQRRLADSLFNDKQFDRAVTAYAPLLQSGDKELVPVALFWSGEAQVALKKADEATPSFRRLIKEYSNHELAARASLRLAQLAYESKSWTEVSRWAQATLDRKPEAASAENALYLLGLAKLAVKDAAGAEAAFRRQLESYPKGRLAAAAREEMALALSGAGKLSEAAPELRAAIAALKENEVGKKGNLQLDLAYVLYRDKKYKEASEVYATAHATLQKAGEKDLASKAALGQAWSLLELPDSAGTRNTAILAAFDKAIAAAPDSSYAADAALGKGNLLFDQKKWDEAARLYRQVVDKAPQSKSAPLAWYQLGSSLYNTRKWEEAAAAFAVAAGFEQSEDALASSFWAGESLRRAGKVNEAKSHFQKFVTTLGAMPATAKDVVEMKKLLPRARLGLGQGLAATGDWKGAVAAYRAALPEAEGIVKAELNFRLGEALAEQGQHKAAADQFLSVLASSEWSSRAQWEAGRNLEKAGDTATARQVYQALSERDPADEWSKQAVEQLQKMGTS